jgi:tRNA 2-thiouridine synthesizing protein A
LRRIKAMGTEVDARGFSCPQPVLMTLEKLKALSLGEIVVLVDTDTAKENVVRAAASQGWEVNDVQLEGADYRITLSKA